MQTYKPSEPVVGIFYRPGVSTATTVTAVDNCDGQLHIRNHNGDLLYSFHHSDTQEGQVVAGIAVDIIAQDGCRFQPQDPEFRWQALTQAGSRQLLQLEKSWLLTGCLMVFMPVFIWVMVTSVVPNAAAKVVPWLPASVAAQVGSSSLAFLDQHVFGATTLDQTTQQRVETTWQRAQSVLPQAAGSYQLHLRDADFANAFALPSGDVIVTDPLVTLFADHDAALLAVLLHEIGHVEHQHGLKLAAQSAANSIIFSYLLGGVDAVGDILVGTSATLLQSAFSRQMETEADAYAFEKLQALGVSPEAFAEAMRLLLEQDNTTTDTTESDEPTPLLEYISSHPDMQQRIHKAKQAAAQWQQQP